MCAGGLGAEELERRDPSAALADPRIKAVMSGDAIADFRLGFRRGADPRAQEDFDAGADVLREDEGNEMTSRLVASRRRRGGAVSAFGRSKRGPFDALEAVSGSLSNRPAAVIGTRLFVRLDWRICGASGGPP